MKRPFLTTTLAITIGLSSFTVPLPIANEVLAAGQTDQQIVEAKADQLIQTAKSLIGKATYSNTEYKPTAPYKFSCATFIMYIFEKNGVDLATYNEDYMMQQGTPVARNQLQKGDLLFFDSRGGKVPNHVAMYIGDNKVIHMADPQQNIVITDLDSKPYYKDNYITARRVLPSLLPSNPATKGDNIVGLSYDVMNKVTMGNVNDEKAMKFTGAGFVNYIYKQNGVNLGTTNLSEQMKKGTTVSRANLKKGDLVFFSTSVGSKTPGLVGIYAGEHRIIIPTSSGVQTRVLFVDYYDQRYLTAKRVFTENAAPTITPPTTNEQSNSGTAVSDGLVTFASSLIGKAKFGYTYDEKSLTFTGAGFTYYVYKKQGIDLKDKLASRQAQVGKVVQKASLQKGDLLFFSTDNKGVNITQTGIYIGANQFISLSTTGEVVKQSLDSAWAKSNYVTARRVL
ncbi:NlpC/P60 family protein [Bacillus sp. FJAT-50079]|uniref:C40 family peptidase n=1 Tax=Bacillus sp. FJAT-50079 TaxID=2833577 RepID=UPI001BC93611|nr:NlpC/P60 family protein [Bacillus sp. FJAT-50079]MBS4206959.1 C40 family peptidase [Bacillus sp. FJAT-50079]